MPRTKAGAAAPESTPYVSTWSVSKGGKALKPIDHNGEGLGASHDQLRTSVAGAEAAPAVLANFAGFAVTKQTGNPGDPHRLSLRSGTLNKNFTTHGRANALSGWTLPTDWAALIKTTLENYLP